MPEQSITWTNPGQTVGYVVNITSLLAMVAQVNIKCMLRRTARRAAPSDKAGVAVLLGADPDASCC